MQPVKSESSTVDARQRLLGAAMASGGRPRLGGARGRRAPSSRLRLDASEQIALAARSTGAASRTVDAACARQVHGAPGDAAALGTRLRSLAHRANVVQAELLEALARFDELEGWRADGVRNCARWICSELGVGRTLAYCQLAVARKLRELPIIAQLFRDGHLSWSKVQALTRVATPQDERALAIMALDLDANTVQDICDEYRWGKRDGDGTDDVERDRQRFEHRSLGWSTRPDGSVVIRAVLPPDMAANVLACLEHRESIEFAHEQDAAAAASQDATSGRTGTQRRADALVAMAEASLDAAGSGVSTADRFQVVVHVDADALDDGAAAVAGSESTSERRSRGRASPCVSTESSADPDGHGFALMDHSQEPGVSSAPSMTLPLPVRAAIAGIGGITPSTARRLACDGSLTTMIMKNGEPIAVGRKTRRWNPATRRAVLARDGGCTFPGCGSTRNLDIHHVDGWAFGGETSVATGASLCRSCHTKVHDEGWRIRRVDDDRPIERHPEAERLLDTADARTLEVTRVLDARRSRFVFERA